MRRLLVAAAVVMASAVATAAPAVADTATFTRTSQWSGGYEGRFTVTNTSTTTMNGWTVVFDVPAGTTVGTYWDALMTQSGNRYTFRNRDYNGTLAPGAAASFGFVASGSGDPTNCTLNGMPCAGGPPDTTPPTVPTGLTVGSPTANSLRLNWIASTDNSGTVNRYEVSRGGAAPVNAGPSTTYTATGLSPNTTYSFRVRACDVANNCSAYTAAVSGTTDNQQPPVTTLPTAPYVDMGAWPTPSLTDMATASGLRGFTLAFITASGCRAMWFNAYDPRQGWARDQIDAIRARGGDVTVSFGGATGIELAQACSTVDALFTEYDAVVRAYALTHIDLDIEGAATAEPASVARRSAALARLQQTHPTLRVSLTLPVLPEGLTADGLTVVRSARDAGVNVDVVNVMAMDYYRDVDYGDAAVLAANSVFAQLRTLYPGRTDAALWRMVGVTPMLGVNDDNRVYNQADARQLVAFAQGRHLGRLAFWEMTRDRNACIGALYRCTNIPQSPYEFSRIFAGYTG
jgi:hypothetical protein